MILHKCAIISVETKDMLTLKTRRIEPRVPPQDLCSMSRRGGQTPPRPMQHGWAGGSDPPKTYAAWLGGGVEQHLRCGQGGCGAMCRRSK